MIKFFRKIRHRLLSENKLSKYLLYALGEIFLVVIGILIALQINNWNEQRKADKIGIQYLKGVQIDLRNDIVLADSVLRQQKPAFGIISSIDSVFHKNPVYNTDRYGSLFNNPDTLLFSGIFYRNLSFRSINSTYQSLISDGQSDLIKNRELFQEIQRIYNESHERIASTYQVIKEIELQISWAYPSEKRYWTYSDLKKAKDEKIFADLRNFTEQKYWYAQNLFDLKIKNQEVIELIDQELKK
ncbi:MAG: DUF6090 family protein [Flavobacteriaceae bacterium]